MERTPPRDVIDLLALARRLDIVQAQPPAPLPRHWDRDGPVKDQQPLPAPRRATGPQNVAPANPAGISYRSRKVLP